VNSKIIVIAASALGLLVALFLGLAVGEGKRMQIAAVFAVMVGAPLLLSLGKNYWYLIPFSLLSGLPAIPFGGRNIELAELAIPLCFGIFVTRAAFKLDKIVFWRATHIPIYLFMAWVFFIFCLYPVGLAAFGAATMGGRQYAQVALAFMAFLIIASREITEKDCKWIILFILAGSAINATYNIASFFFFGPGDEILNPGSDSGGFYTWHQNLAGPAMAGAFLLFAWKKPRDILGFRNPLLLLLYILALGLTLFSGKRMALIAVCLAPLVSSIVYRQYAYIFVGALLAAVFSLSVIFGHGELFRLPLQIQRTLSWMPAKWDSEFQNMSGGRDDFRESLRRFAMENIKRYPIIGRGFAIDYSEIIGQIGASRYLGGSDMQAAPYAIGRAWHNRWLGYAADFGIPLSVILAILYLVLWIVTWKTQRRLENNTYRKILVVYIFIEIVKDTLASHTSGHSSTDAYQRWWMYAVVFSIYASVSVKQVKERLSLQKSPFMQRVLDKKFHEA
jgi:hypothetical protein